MNKFKKSIALLLIAVMVLSFSSFAFGEKTDISNHWAKEEIQYLMKKEIINGYPDGTFRPEKNIKRAEFYKIVNELIGYEEKAKIKFDDVKDTDWFYGHIQKGVKANYIKEGKTLNPNVNITREEVAEILSIVFGIEENLESAKKFKDYDSIPKDLRGVFGGLTDKKYLSGYPDGTVKPKGEIKRSEAVKMIRNISGEIVNLAGKYTENTEGNVLVNTASVVLKDMTIKGDLYLTEGIGQGDVTLDNVRVDGTAYIRGGGENSIIIVNSKIGDIIVKKENNNVRVVIDENTDVLDIVINENTILVIKKGAKIESIKVTGKAKIEVEKGADVGKIEIASKDVEIKAEGNIGSIVSTEDVKVNDEVVKKGTESNVKNGKVVIQATDTPSTPPFFVGGGGTPIPSVVVSAISVDKTTLTLTAGGATGTITATVLPTGATNKSVTWATSNNVVATVVNGVVTPKAVGTATITATTVDGGFSKTILVTVNPVTPPVYALTKALTNATVIVDNETSEEDAKAALDTTVGVVGTKGETGTANIAWTIESYKGSILGEYPATGVLTLPTDWTGTAGNVTATVRVTKANVPSSITLGSGTLNSTNPYLVDGKPAMTGTLGDGKCTAHFDSLTGVLSLQNYVGGEIRINEAGKDLRIKLIGNANKITGGQFGIHNDKGDIHITSDSEALLEIEINSSFDGAAIANGWSTMAENPSVLIDGEVKLRIKAEYTGDKTTNSITGIYAGRGSVTIQDKADYSATLTNLKNQGRGIRSSSNTIINTAGKIEIDVSKSLQGIGIYGMDGIEIQQVNSMLITIPSTGEDTNTKFTSGTVNVSSGVAVNKSTTKASYRSGTPYTLGLVGGKITTATGDVIGSPHQYLEGDEITIESTISEFDRWTKANGGVLETTLFTGGTTANTPTATIKMPAGSLSIKAREKEIGTEINIAAISGVVAPVKGVTPVTTITNTAQYTGTVTWSPKATKFAGDTVYTATITLVARPEFKLDGVDANFFTVAGAATVTNEKDTGEIIAVFPATEADTLIDIAAIPGVVAPVTGATPVTTSINTTQYTGTVAWTPANNPFAAKTVYTATIKLTAKPGFTLTGVAPNFFTVNGIETTHVAGVVTVEFPVTAASDFAAGSGTVGDPYLVSSAEELNKVRNHPDKHFKQTANIDLSTYTADGGWQPIGDSTEPFIGTYNGKNFNISNLTINRLDEDNQGLFGYINYGYGSVLENISLTTVNVEGNNSVGGLVGYFNNGTITSCNVVGTVNGKRFVGGLVGQQSFGTITSSYTTGTVNGTENVGGLVGYVGTSGSITKCYSTAAVSNTTNKTGGLVGSNQGTIDNSYATGAVESKNYVGGLVGRNSSTTAITNCYATGKVTAETDMGGLIGLNFSALTPISSYYDQHTTGQSDEGKGVRKTTSEMKQADTFVGWDFTNIWKIDEGSSYPKLK